MTIQQNSPGSRYAIPLSLFLWCLHGALAWFFSRSVGAGLAATGVLALICLLTQHFANPSKPGPMLWRPGLLAYCVLFSWCLWGLLNIWWDFGPTRGVLIWPAIAFIVNYSSKAADKKARHAKDLGV